MIFWKKKKKIARPRPYSMYNKEGKKKLKEAFELKAENKIKEEEIRSQELEIREESLSVKRAKLKRDAARYKQEMNEYIPREEPAEYEEYDDEEDDGNFNNIIEMLGKNLLKKKGVETNDAINNRGEGKVKLDTEEARRDLFRDTNTKEE